MQHVQPESYEGAYTKAGVGLIIHDDAGRIVLELRKDCGEWGLPGGKIDPGESASAAALRETLEETGLLVELEYILGVYSDPAERTVLYEGRDLAHLIDVIFVARVTGGELRDSEESLSVKFFEPDHLPDNLVVPALAPLADYRSGGRALIR